MEREAVVNSPLWSPSPERRDNCQMARFQRSMVDKYQLPETSYQALHRWSIEHRADFWGEMWQLGEIIHSQPFHQVLAGDSMPGARWFEGSRLNYAENLLRYRDRRPAIVALLEQGERRVISYSLLYRQVAKLAHYLRQHGIKPGDRIAGFLPNIPEAVVAMLACTSIGAVWSSCSPDFGLNGVLDRFGQIEPRILFSADGYHYNGKANDCLATARQIIDRIPAIEQLVVVPLLGEHLQPGSGQVRSWSQCLDNEAEHIEFEQLPFDHPLYILYSSGTTGIPKCIVHSAGGTLIQHLKEHQLHTDIDRDDVFFYFTTCGWMMWNWLVSGLASGCTLVLYDGSPFARDGHRLLDAIDEEGITVFGTSARYLSALQKAGHKPRLGHRLDSLQTLLSTGSPLSPESFEYVYRDIKQDLCLASISGGTDIVSTFVLGNPMLPVYSGEIQVAGLGMAVEIRDQQANSIKQARGELVCTRAFPSMPLGFWRDEDNRKFNSAYFERFPGIWAQGDYAEITAHNGFIIHGRSDAVLNPGGVRIGTAEIYRQVEKLDDIVDSVVVGQQWQDDVRVVLFVVLRPGQILDNSLRDALCRQIRAGTTPRHVPAKIIQVEDIPRTISGKTAEIAVRDAIHDRDIDNQDALANPAALEFFRNLDELTKE